MHCGADVIVSNAAVHGRSPSRVTNGRADNVTGRSAVPQKADDSGAPRKSVEVGQFRKSPTLAATREVDYLEQIAFGLLQSQSVNANFNAIGWQALRN
jgi:hypothetical protein